MKKSQLPYCFHKVWDNPSLNEIKNISHYFGVVADVTVNDEANSYICRIGERVRYCTGKFRTVLCGDELALGLKEGSIEKVHFAASYRMTNLFEKFVNHWFKAKEKAKDNKRLVESEFAKMMLNSLYGRFALKSPAWVDCPDVPAIEEFGEFSWMPVGAEKFRKFRSWAGNVQEKIESVDGRNSFCAIAAFITSNARCYMRRIRQQLPEKSVYYTHTDSMIINDNGYWKLHKLGFIGNKIGQFRETESPTDTAEFFGPGDYVYGGKRVCFGIKDNATILSESTVEQDEYLGVHATLANNPNGITQLRRKIISRNQEGEKLSNYQSGWVVPFVFSSVPFPVSPFPSVVSPFPS